MATNTTSFKIFELFTGDPSEKIRHKKRKKYISIGKEKIHCHYR